MLGAKIEGTAQDAGKNEHPRHAEDILHTQDQLSAAATLLFGIVLMHGVHLLGCTAISTFFYAGFRPTIGNPAPFKFSHAADDIDLGPVFS